ncbi:hypothetical protein FBBAL38_08849 [Flavobacteria bacterium BAL38]|nr:hypothetical protein FBBAL38_08849 [Flavobacteria bacterium BAL38]
MLQQHLVIQKLAAVQELMVMVVLQDIVGQM